MVEIEFLGPIKMSNLKLEAANLSEVKEKLGEYAQLGEWLKICAVAVNDETSRPAVAPAGHQQNQLPQVQNNNGEISAADLQAMANQKQLEENKAIEDANRKVREENEAARTSACNTAKINLQHAQTARIQNREQLIQQYQNNVNQYCN